jgi:hypothetical protein
MLKGTINAASGDDDDIGNPRNPMINSATGANDAMPMQILLDFVI